jgi:hypothetical protein
MRSLKRYFFILTLLLLGLLFNLQVTPTLAAAKLLVDFEGGLPGGWFAYSGGGASVTADTLVVADSDTLARPGQVGDNTVLSSTFDVSSGFGGFGQDFAMAGGSQDWSTYTGVSFWFYGSNSGQSFQFEIFDNRSDPGSDTAERFDTLFSDNFSGWQQITIPFSDFTRATDFQPGGAPNDGLTLTEMWGWAVILDGAAGTIYMDDIGLEKTIVDDFESGLPVGTDANGNQIGFFTFNDPNSTVAITTTDTPPAPVPDSSATNNVLQVDTNVNNSFGFAGVIHAFENEAVNTWTPQDWSSFTGFSFWLYGNNTGQILFVDILDNRVPGSTGDTAERYSVDIIDDFSGWRLFEIPFADFNRKEVGNGAPNDGFTLTEVHGWAFGVFNAGQAFTNYLDDVGLFGNADVPELNVTFSANFYQVTEGGNAQVAVKLSRPFGEEDDPEEVTVSYATEDGSATAGRDYTATTGTLTFTADGPTEQTFTLSTLDDNKFEGGETVILRLSDPVGAPLGFVFQSRIDINDNDAYDPSLIDDFEDGIDLWHSSDNVILANPEIAAGAPMALPGQGAFERILSVTAPLHVNINVQSQICNQGNGIVTIVLPTTADFDATTVARRPKNAA